MSKQKRWKIDSRQSTEGGGTHDLFVDNIHVATMNIKPATIETCDVIMHHSNDHPHSLDFAQHIAYGLMALCAQGPHIPVDLGEKCLRFDEHLIETFHPIPTTITD